MNCTYGELAFTGGLLQLTQDTGIPSGTINTGSFPFIIDSGKMDPSKSAMIFNSHKGGITTQFDLTIAVKGGGSYNSSDISGTWHLFGLCSRPAGTGAVRGFMSISNSGAVTGSFVLGGGTANPIDSGAVSIILGSPVFTGNFDTDTTGGLVTRRIENGILDNSKTFASFFAYVSPDGGATISESEIVVMIKEAGPFSNPDLAGTWYMAGASAGNLDPADDGPITGNLTMNATGTITGGSLTLPGAAAGSITGGSMNVNAAGALAGTIKMRRRQHRFHERPPGRLEKEDRIHGYQCGSDSGRGEDALHPVQVIGLQVKGSVQSSWFEEFACLSRHSDPSGVFTKPHPHQSIQLAFSLLKNRFGRGQPLPAGMKIF